MSEIRIKPKNLLFLILAIVFGLYLIARHGNFCSKENVIPNRFLRERLDNLPTIYAITPTYFRPVQKAELTRSVGSHHIINDISINSELTPQL